MVVMVCQIDVGAQPEGSHLSVYHNRCLFVISVGGWTSGSVSCTKTCSVSLIKHLLSYIRYISDQMASALSSLCPQKMVTECCSLRDAFSGNIAVFNVHK